jgi:hypothetical protein
MNKQTTLLRKKLLFLLIPVLVGVAYLGSTVLSSPAKKGQSIVKVRNQTKSCEVLSAEKHQNHIKMILKNNNDKAITAFLISSRTSPEDVFSVKVEFAYSESDFSITPGSTYEKVFGIDSDLNAQETPSLVLSAVIFDDKSSEGDLQFVQEIEDERLAEKIEFMRTITLLDKMLALSNNELQTYFNKDLKEDLFTALNLSKKELTAQLVKERPQMKISKEADEIPESIEIGLQTGRASVYRKIQYLETIQQTQDKSTLREEIIQIKQTYQKLINRL